MINNKPFKFTNNGKSIQLDSPTTLPNASGYLWNSQMMINMNCRGYAVSQFMQPEPAKYSYAPNMEAKTFMQPEHAYFAHHPGRFFYIKDEDTGEIYSAPYEPVRAKLDQFCFITNQHNISWVIEKLDIKIELSLTLTVDKPLELWDISVTNLSDRSRKLSIYPYFTVGYMSWLNQSATFEPSLNSIVATCVTPYQKVEDYPINKEFKDKTFLMFETQPTSWTTSQKQFEGEGGLHNPDDVNQVELSKTAAVYETPVAVLQYRVNLKHAESKVLKFVFGAAKTNEEIHSIEHCLFGNTTEVDNTAINKNYDMQKTIYQAYIESGHSIIKVESPDDEFNHFVNFWLPRQMYYHGDVNRLSTDPQTRNYLQDNMGMCFIEPDVARESFITSLSQQKSNGVMPDGILLHAKATLKYINQVPHTDHSVWLPVCLLVYLSETNDKSLLTSHIPFSDTKKMKTVKAHIDLAMHALIAARDHRGLSYIEQGDWCDPMNMVGYKGKGVSSWLSLATAYALNVWCEICEKYFDNNSIDSIELFKTKAKEINQAVNEHLWDGSWYGRGITDDNVKFGVKKDVEGRIYLNPQSWSILSKAASTKQVDIMLTEIDKQLSTPFGPMMLAPSYTHMREDIGRLTQKHPGVSENGAVYNHAAIFYAYSLYTIGQSDEAFEVLYKMLPLDSSMIRGQLPNFIPNYYRGAYKQFPEQAGKSSHLFNTGTIAWYQRCVIEGLCGVKGDSGNLIIKPQLPSQWEYLKVTRYYQGSVFIVNIMRVLTDRITVKVDGITLDSNVITHIIKGKTYQVIVEIPLASVK